MASTVASGIFNAFAFAGAGFLFSKLNHNDYKEEMKRHNLALEKLAFEKEKWNKKEIERRDKIAQYRQELADANVDINTTNYALSQIHQLNLNWEREPVLEDFYRPSKEMQEYQHIASGAMGLVGGWLLGKVITIL